MPLRNVLRITGMQTDSYNTLPWQGMSLFNDMSYTNILVTCVPIKRVNTVRYDKNKHPEQQKAQEHCT